MILVPFRYAPSPCRAMKRSPSSGASIIPSTGCPSITSDSEIEHSGLSRAKLMVPSIGSSTTMLPEVLLSAFLFAQERDLGRGARQTCLDLRLDPNVYIGREVAIPLVDQGTDVRADVARRSAPMSIARSAASSSVAVLKPEVAGCWCSSTERPTLGPPAPPETAAIGCGASEAIDVPSPTPLTASLMPCAAHMRIVLRVCGRRIRDMRDLGLRPTTDVGGARRFRADGVLTADESHTRPATVCRAVPHLECVVPNQLATARTPDTSAVPLLRASYPTRASTASSAARQRSE